MQCNFQISNYVQNSPQLCTFVISIGHTACFKHCSRYVMSPVCMLSCKYKLVDAIRVCQGIHRLHSEIPPFEKCMDADP